MSLGSRWQALLLLLLSAYFHIAECQNFGKGGLNSLEYVIYWQHVFLNHLFCSLCIIAFLLNAEVKPLQMTEGHKSIHVSSVVFSYGFSRQITNTQIKNKWVAVTVNNKLFGILLFNFYCGAQYSWGGGNTRPSFNTTFSQNGTYSSSSVTNNWKGKITEYLFCLSPDVLCPILCPGLSVPALPPSFPPRIASLV